MSRNNTSGKKSRVAVVRTTPLTVMEDYSRVMHLAAYQDHIAAGSSNILKINLSWREWFPAAATAPWQLEGVLLTLAEDGFDAEGNTVCAAAGDAAWEHDAEILNGLATAARKGSASIVTLTPDNLQHANIIHLPTMKTHARAGLTGAAMSVWETFKASTASVPESAPDPFDIHEQIVDSLILQQQTCGGAFTVMDGVLAADGAGPKTIIPYEKNYLLAGADPIAVDAVAAHMMGFEPLHIEYIRMATERGIGQGDLGRVELVGDDITTVDFHFTGGEERRPSLGERYLDYFWYPFRGGPHIGRIAESEWGQLLQQYLPDGAELERQGKGKGPVLAVIGAVALVSIGAVHQLRRRYRRGT